MQSKKLNKSFYIKNGKVITKDIKKNINARKCLYYLLTKYNFGISNKELSERLIEFDIIVNDKIDYINLNSLFDYYQVAYNFHYIYNLINKYNNTLRDKSKSNV